MLEVEGGLEWHDLVGLQFNPAAQKYHCEDSALQL